MAIARRVPRPFEMHWGSGEIVEEAAYDGEHHEPVIQLMEYTEGAAAGSVSIRFATYGHNGRFSRNPLIIGDDEIDGLREALKSTPRLRALLQRLVE